MLTAFIVDIHSVDTQKSTYTHWIISGLVLNTVLKMNSICCSAIATNNNQSCITVLYPIHDCDTKSTANITDTKQTPPVAIRWHLDDVIMVWYMKWWFWPLYMNMDSLECRSSIHHLYLSFLSVSLIAYKGGIKYKTSAQRQKGLTGYCFKYKDRSFCLWTDEATMLWRFSDILVGMYVFFIFFLIHRCYYNFLFHR